MDLRRDGRQFDAWEPVVWEFTSVFVLLGLVPAVVAIERRYPIRFDTWRRSVVTHTLATVPFSLVHVGGMLALRNLAYWVAGTEYHFGALARELPYEYLKDFRTYALILFIIHVHRFFVLQLQGEVRLLSIPEQSAALPVLENRPERFLISKLGKEFLIAAADIEWLEASGNYVNLHVRGRSYPLRSTMNAIAPRLDPKRFKRVHRGYIVNLDQIVTIEPLESGDARLHLRDGVTIACSRRYRYALRASAMSA